MPDPSYYPKAILGEQLESLSTDIATDMNKKVNIANIDLSGQTTTLLSKVQEMGNTAVHYRRYYTTGDASAAGISDKPVSGSGFLVEILCNRRNNANDWRYALIGYSLGHKPYFASVSNLDTSISWTQLFSWDNVRTSSDTSSWSSDNSNVPTRAAVESKISSAMSGSLGGFLGPKSPNDISLYQLSGHTFLKGDWFVVSESGSAYYYPNNNRSASAITLNMLEGEEYYWTTSGTFVKKPSTSLQIYAITNLSDWNDLTNTGLYQISVSGATNAPSTGTFSCLVSNENDNIRQIAFKSNNIYYRGKGYNTPWTAWKNVDDVTHAANATTAANYITDQSTTVSIHSKFTSVDNLIYDISNYKKIRVVNNLPSSPDSDTIYFI